jgi:hypothetical protein
MFYVLLLMPLAPTKLDGSLDAGQVPATNVQLVWQELDYRIDICRVTKGGKIEHL